MKSLITAKNGIFRSYSKLDNLLCPLITPVAEPVPLPSLWYLEQSIRL